MQNAVLVGLSRQVALARELDVVANNIANLNTTGYKADGSLFEEYLSTGARADQTGSRVSFVRDRGIWHDMSQGAVEHTGNPLDVAIDGKGFSGGADAARRTLHPQRLDADQCHRSTRHQRRLSGARRRRSDHAAAKRSAGLDQPRRHDQRARRHLEGRFGARQTPAGHVRQSAAAAKRRQRHLQPDRRRAAATCDDGRPYPGRASRNPTCAASSRCRA